MTPGKTGGGNFAGRKTPSIIQGFTSSEVKAFTTELQPEQVQRWKLEVGSAVESKKLLAAHILDMTALEWRNIMNESAEYRAADAWLGTNVKVLLNRESVYVSVLLDGLCMIERGMSSGWLIWRAITQGPGELDARMQREQQIEFEATVYFRPGDSVVVTQ